MLSALANIYPSVAQGRSTTVKRIYSDHLETQTVVEALPVYALDYWSRLPSLLLSRFSVHADSTLRSRASWPAMA